MKKSSIFCFVLLICSIFSTSVGCQILPFVSPFVSPIVTLYVKWIEGEAHAYFATDSKTAYKATKRVLAEFNYTVTKEKQPNSTDFFIVADSNDRFKINIKQVEPLVTKISIRINTMGDKDYVELIYQKLQTQLEIIDFTKYEQRRLRRQRGL